MCDFSFWLHSNVPEPLQEKLDASKMPGASQSNQNASRSSLLTQSSSTSNISASRGKHYTPEEKAKIQEVRFLFLQNFNQLFQGPALYCSRVRSLDPRCIFEMVSFVFRPAYRFWTRVVSKLCPSGFISPRAITLGFLTCYMTIYHGLGTQSRSDCPADRRQVPARSLG
jgi:hypothetical protein